MSASPRTRIAILTVIVVLSVVQPALAGTRTGDAAGGIERDVGSTIGSTVDRHPASAGATEEALRAVRADAVHARGLTGSGVDVGVIGRGFDATGVVAPHVVDRRRFGGRPGATAHDTAVAEVVSETAPAANLYLASIGRTPTPAEYAAAVDWLTDRGVDVIVDSGSYFPTVAADERRITAAAERATENGVVFVTSAGNYANRHWAGEGTADGWLSFAPGDAANALGDGGRIRGRVTVRLRWRSGADYDLYLYRRIAGARDRVVAKSVGDDTGPGLTIEGFDVIVPRGRYYVAIYADDPVTPPGSVQVFAARHPLEHTTAYGSMVAPATSERVVAVGAASRGERRVYSSLSASGAVDLTAPSDARTRAAAEFGGTSAAAPYVAGTAALMESGGRDPSPDRVEAILERTADGENDTLDALAAVEAATGKAPTDRAGSRNGAASDGARGTADDANARDRRTVRSTARNRTHAVGDRNATRTGGTERDPSTGRSADDRTSNRSRERNRDSDGPRNRSRGNRTDTAEQDGRTRTDRDQA